MLLKKILTYYFIIGVILYAYLIGAVKGGINPYNTVNVLVFFSYFSILFYCTNKEEIFYSNSRLVSIIFSFSLIFVFAYMELSQYYRGNTFMFSEIDAYKYQRHSFIMKDMNFSDALNYISKIWKYDDWGGPMSMALFLKIIPSKYFLNFCYIILNTISGYWLFNIGKMIMSREYAFIASLSYTIASYTLFFEASFLKETTMIFLLVGAFYYLYKFWSKQNLLYLIIAVIFSIFVLFFRPAVSIFIWTSFIVMIILNTNNNVFKIFYGLLVIFSIIIAYDFTINEANRFTNEGDIANSYIVQHTTTFQKAVSVTCAFIGSFPSMVMDKMYRMSYKFLYGSGELFKLFLFFPFWKGVIYSIKSRSSYIYPLFIFIIIEMVSLSIVVDGIELRKSLPHIPFFIITAFWFLYQYDNEADSQIRATPFYVWTERLYSVICVLILIAVIVWNTLR